MWTVAKPIFSFGEKDHALSRLAGEIIQVSPLCPDGMTCFVDGTMIDVKFTLNGCLDTLGPVTYDAVETDDGRLIVFVSALNVHHQDSKVTFCYVAPTEVVKLQLINKYGDVEVRFLGQLNQN
jgi:hypothetical protein